MYVIGLDGIAPVGYLINVVVELEMRELLDLVSQYVMALQLLYSIFLTVGHLIRFFSNIFFCLFLLIA